MFDRFTKVWTSLNKTVTINQRELVLGTIACTMTGMVIGMLISPRKTVTVGSHNGSNNTLPQPAESAEETASEA